MSAQEFKVGQVVSGDDYARLPIDAVTSGIRKVGEHEWRYNEGAGAPMFDAPYASRILTHLPEVPEPEDTDDVEPEPLADWERALLDEADEDIAYIEDEPLKEGDWVQVWAQYVTSYDSGELHLRVSGAGGYVAAHPDAIVRPSAGQVPPWVKPVEEPATLGSVAFCEEGSVFVRVDLYGKQPWMRSAFDERRAWDEIPAVERVVEGVES
jgi:hypothetical protein